MKFQIELSDFEVEVLDNWNKVWYNDTISTQLTREELLHRIIRQGLGIQPVYYTFTSAGTSANGVPLAPIAPGGAEEEL